ncbi:MAG: AzlD domain-containing protein [Rhodobacteraceae bacterium]|nr:AzlD domain-containing protein [Paracoccaceae bacterium]
MEHLDHRSSTCRYCDRCNRRTGTGSVMIWVVMITTGIMTFLMRFSMFSGLINKPLPASFDRYLRYVPIAVLSAIIAASVVIDPATNAPNIGTDRALAAIIAVIVALVTKSVLSTIAVGLSVLWVLQNLV